MIPMRLENIALMCVFGLVFWDCQNHHMQPQQIAKDNPSQVSVDSFLSYVKIKEVEETEPMLTLSLVGKIHLHEESTQLVASPLSGRVQKILVKRGDLVVRNQPLVEIISPVIADLYNDRQRCLENVSVFKSNLERSKSLLVEGAIAQKDFEVVQAEFEKAQSDLHRNTQQMQSLSLPLQKTSSSLWLLARMDGKVIERYVSLGQEVRSDAVEPLLVVGDLSQVMLTADLYEKDLSFVHVGDTVSMVVPAYPGQVFQTRIESIDDMLHSSRRTFQVRCIVENQDFRLKPEMFAKIEIRTQGARGIWIPDEAIVIGEQGSKVLIIDQQRHITSRSIEASNSQSGLRRVYQGLSQGEQIVVQGSVFLQAELER